MNPLLNTLQPYPFEKLAALKSGISPPDHLQHIALSIGEPQHPAPDFVVRTLAEHMSGLSHYPTTKGIPALREAIAKWCTQRFQLQQPMNAETQVLPVNGTREALFSFAQAVIDPAQKPVAIMPNPFYQIYEGAALLAGAEPYFIHCVADNGFIPDFSSVPVEIWQRCQLLFICSPGNPTGSVINIKQLQALIALADKYDFIIAGDECYSELYFDEARPPAGLLQACSAMGRHDFKRCVVFHSLSKRSNLPGLRSGFVGGDATILGKFLLYRTYHGCAMPLQHQHASIAAWNDEQHVVENRLCYTEKFSAVLEILEDCITAGKISVSKPDAGFYLWAKIRGSDTEFSRALFSGQNVTVLPGSFLSRESGGINPGAGYIRMALVAPLAECIDAAHRIKQFLDKQ
ncbi:MAG: succinyldiaminopimelate transaminase [Pseudomonadales bacterium]|jgi:N-succinyldiaminopimelate aminotransferase|nr:succinyldiaminopimelate transaminase [Pseudomonadales bacterium]